MVQFFANQILWKWSIEDWAIEIRCRDFKQIFNYTQLHNKTIWILANVKCESNVMPRTNEVLTI